MRRRRVIAAVVIGIAATGGAVAVHRAGDGAPPAHAPSLAAIAVAGPLGLLPDNPGLVAKRAETRAITKALRHRGWVAHGVPRSRFLALTFDDGPGPDTPAVLRVLRRKRVKATFFVVGEMARARIGMLRAIHRAGHEISGHTEHHPLLDGMKAGEQAREIDAVSRLLHRHDFAYPRLFRPPYGSSDRTTRRLLRARRMLMVLWSIDSEDYTRPGAPQIVRNVVGDAKPGSIVLMHDGGGPRAQTVQALGHIIDALRRRRYRLVTVPALLRFNPPPRNLPRTPRFG